MNAFLRELQTQVEMKVEKSLKEQSARVSKDTFDSLVDVELAKIATDLCRKEFGK